MFRGPPVASPLPPTPGYSSYKNLTGVNVHAAYPRVCGEPVQEIHPDTLSLFEYIHQLFDERPWKFDWSTWKFSREETHFHSQFDGASVKKQVEQLSVMQVCMYSALDRWKELAQEYNMRWSAHGGTLMGAKCYSSMNPWDDDIDLTVSHCKDLDGIFKAARGAPASWSTYWYTTKYLDDDWIIMKLHWKKWLGLSKQNWNWYKIKPRVQMDVVPTDDPSGIDIGCLEAQSRTESQPMLDSGYTEYLSSDKPLQEVEFGPTTLNVVSNEVTDAYIYERYGTDDPCGFPYNKDPGYALIKYPRPSYHDSDPPSDNLTFAVDTWYVSLEDRLRWASQVGQVSGQALTQALANLTAVEVENSISTSCVLGTKLKVIEFNAERGTRWAEFASMVQDPASALYGADVIILNEMDIGMARSGNVHTTRKLAYELGMNYAWGLEFVELSRGTKPEQEATKGQENLMGLHGNAILTKCQLYDPLVVREEFDPNFFTRKAVKVNARGYEQRLGSRMGMFLRMSATPYETNTPHVVVGSIHKISTTKHSDTLQEYFGIAGGSNNTATIGTIIAGDNDRGICAASGLSQVDNAKHSTYPARCQPRVRTGKFRGDFFCSNLKVDTPDQVVPPCADDGLELSDHSIIVMSLQLPA